MISIFLRGSSAAMAVMLVGMASPALADAIDGDWCRGDGKHMTIRGPQIVTSGGTKTSGD